MYVVIYYFKAKKDKEAEFLELWKAMTLAIRENCKGLGSRLHKESDLEYIAYAQWPDQNTFDQAKLPKEFDELTSQFKAVTSSVKVLYKLEAVDDLLIEK